MYPIDVYVGNKQYSGLVDSCANRSVINTETAKELHWQYKITNDEIYGIGGAQKRSVLNNKQEIIVNKKVVNVQFEVQNLFPPGTDFLIGTDIMEICGIYLTGFALEGNALGEDSKDLECHPSNHTTVKNTKDNVQRDIDVDQYIRNALATELTMNANTSMEPCTAPGSLVHLTLKPDASNILKSIHRNHMPKSSYERFLGQCKEWVQDNISVINEMSPVVNSPMLEIIRRDDAGEICKIRYCLNPSSINAATEDDQIIIPKVKDIIEEAVGHKFYSVLDMKNGFWKFPVDDDTSRLLAFTAPDGVQYRFIRAPFGLKQLLSLYQRVMSNVLNIYDNTSNYVDDLNVMGNTVRTTKETLEGHIEHLRLVINKLTYYNITINIDKCKFGQSRIKLLGFTISEEGSEIEKSRLRKAFDWIIPKTGKDIQSWLGFINFFREYIPNYSDITAPFECLRYVKKITWSTELSDKFEHIKHHLVEESKILSKYNPKLPLILEVDASGRAIASVLYQSKEGEEISKRKYLQFFSKTLSDAQQRYGITKKELLGIVLSLRKLREFLMGKSFSIVTDHKALLHLHNNKDKNDMISRWADTLYSFPLAKYTYKEGKMHILPDFLTRNINLNATNVISKNYSCEWSLNVCWFKVLDQLYGPHDIDMFANKNNRQLKIFAAENGEGEGNAFDLDWSLYKNIYMNIPFRLVNVIIKKIVSDKATVTIVVPISLGSLWLKTLIKLSIDQPTFINHEKNTFTDINGTVRNKPPWRWTAAFRVSGNDDCPKITIRDNFWHRIGYKPFELNTEHTATVVNMVSTRSQQKKVHSQPNEITTKTSTSAASKDEQSIRTIVIDRAAELHMYGHIGPKALQEFLVEEGYGMKNSTIYNICVNTVQSCLACARNSKARAGFLIPRSIHANLPFDHVAIDLLQLETSVNGMNYVLVIKDVLTKFVILKPLSSKNGEELARTLFDIFCLFGFPRVWQSDNGLEFKNRIMASWKKAGLFDHRFTTPYNPRANGLVERANQDIVRMIKALSNGNTTKWCTILPLVQLYMNAAISRTHRHSPYALMFMRKFLPHHDNPESILDINNLDISTNALEERMELIKLAHQEIYPQAAKNLKQYHAQQEQQMLKHRKLVERLPPKTVVMIKDHHRTKKLDNHFTGPFTIVKQTPYGAYELLGTSGHLHPTRVPPHDIRVVSMPSPTEMSCEIETILDDRIENGLQEYHIKWKGFGTEYNTWEPISMFDTHEIISEYHRKKK